MKQTIVLLLFCLSYNSSAQETITVVKGQDTFFVENPRIPSGKIYTYVDQMPEFPGGNVSACLAQQLNYPAEAVAKKIEGRVTVQFILDEEGRVQQAKS